MDSGSNIRWKISKSEVGGVARGRKLMKTLLSLDPGTGWHSFLKNLGHPENVDFERWNNRCFQRPCIFRWVFYSIVLLPLGKRFINLSIWTWFYLFCLEWFNCNCVVYNKSEAKHVCMFISFPSGITNIYIKQQRFKHFLSTTFSH